ncbi:MAG: alanine--tRNA ligase [Alphaproteobacteria bacterium]|nr:alanine--tRNA ligase [Alphaproteobacteria bacterium]
MSPATPRSGKEIRRSFVEFFAAQGHVIVPSSSLVPDNDPTLMFTNSGMVQFKNNFTGVDTRLKRAASVQRCVRAGGKHNDLENVGHTARHHTFFEMLGNFSFGDYFKEQSLTWGWQWVTEVLKLDPARICVTYYHEDEEARQIWKKIGVADKDIIPIASNANFWTMGDTGPCGPCSEIFYDLDPSGKMYGDRPGTPDEDGDRWMEIWNHVFTQFDLQKDGTKVPLANKNIDTGAGLERIMCAVQGVQSNYDTDVFQAIIQAAAARAGVADYHAIKATEQGVSLRVVADHLRAMSFLLTDGVLPGNEGRGYVLRRIMRRAMRHGHLLGVEQPFIHSLVPALVGQMGEAYPELQRAAPMVADVIKLEEERFGRTLKQGMSLLESESQGLKAGDRLPGEVAFKLYDTYGFPLDLTQDALRNRQVEVDLAGFETAMNAQRARARAAHKGSGDSALADVWYSVQEACGATEFLGYSTLQAEGVVQALVHNGQRVASVKAGETVQLVTNQTPFYAESGGQVGDTGSIKGAGAKGSWQGTVTDCQKVLGTLFVHTVQVTSGSAHEGDALELQVDVARRSAIARNHTATHLLFAGLREVLGSHVVQRGSRQDDQLTRFDLSHPKGLTPEEVTAVEDFVNQRIWQNLPVVTRIVDKEEAVKSGATAQFGEKYGDEVRVVYIGTPESANLVTADLCGGTHVGQTGEIGLLRIVHEGSVSAGVRRLEAVTGPVAYQSFRTDASLLKEAASGLKCKVADVPTRVAELQANAKKAAKAAPAGGAVDVSKLLGGKQTVQGMAAIVAEVPNADSESLRVAVESLKGSLGSGVVLLGSHTEGKTTLVAGVTKDLSGKLGANALLTEACKAINGRGGGRPELAMGGGEGPVASALAAGRAFLGA